MRHVERRTALSLLFLLVALVVWPSVAAAQDLTMYEVTEQVRLDKHGRLVLSRLAALQGTANVGTPLCPHSILAKSPGATSCTVTALANASPVDPVTFSVQGEYAVVVQDVNPVDSPEIVVQEGQFVGTVDVSLAVLAGLPLLSIQGTFTVPAGKRMKSIPFTGTFRLPFTSGGSPPLYLLDPSTSSVVPVAAVEHSLGVPTVRLEVNFQ
jgi:hypothetical protein